MYLSTATCGELFVTFQMRQPSYLFVTALHQLPQASPGLFLGCAALRFCLDRCFGRVRKEGGSCTRTLILTRVGTPRRCKRWSWYLEVQVTTTKQFGTFMTSCHPIVEELAASVQRSPRTSDCVCHISSSRSATNAGRNHLSCCRRGSWTDCGGGVPSADKCVRIWTSPPRRVHWIATRHNKGGRCCRVDCKSTMMFLGVTLTTHLWICTNKSDAANPFVGAWSVAQETKRVSELKPGDSAPSQVLYQKPLSSC